MQNGNLSLHLFGEGCVAIASVGAKFHLQQ